MEMNVAQVPRERDAYRAFVAEVAGSCDPRVILNRDPDHAPIVIARLFDHSQLDVAMLISTLDSEAYRTQEFVEAAIHFLQRDPAARIRIITEGAVPARHSLLEAARVAGIEDRIKISQLPASLRTSLAFNFIVGDGRHFRYEPSPNEAAFVLFGDEERGGQLKSIFDAVEKQLQPGAVVRVLEPT